jgi:hypothetical protein
VFWDFVSMQKGMDQALPKQLQILGVGAVNASSLIAKLVRNAGILNLVHTINAIRLKLEQNKVQNLRLLPTLTLGDLREEDEIHCSLFVAMQTCE